MLTLKEKLEALARGDVMLTNFGVKIHLQEEGLMGVNTNAKYLMSVIEDMTEIYRPHALKLGPEHVGKRVRLRNGWIDTIIGFRPDVEFCVVTHDRTLRADGSAGGSGTFDIVKVLD